jgi:hypothetical protein
MRGTSPPWEELCIASRPPPPSGVEPSRRPTELREADRGIHRRGAGEVEADGDAEQGGGARGAPADAGRGEDGPLALQLAMPFRRVVLRRHEATAWKGSAMEHGRRERTAEEQRRSKAERRGLGHWGRV